MFCCLLLHKEAPDQPIVSRKCDLQSFCVGFVGKGTAAMEFEIPQVMKSVVLYIPTLLQQSSGARSRVRVTKCVIQERRGSEIVRSDVFQLSRNSTASARGPVPSYSQIKSRCTKAVLSYSGAQSPYDCIFYIGDIEKGSSLLATVDFLTNMEPTTVSAGACYVYSCLFPCEDLRMKTLLCTASAIESVTPMDAQLSLIEVSQHHANQYTVVLRSHPDLPHSKGITHGFCLQLVSDSFIGSCFTAVLTKCLSVHLPSGDQVQTFDGVLMGSFMYAGTRDIITSPVLVPSEFVFIVDCSGSMSGLKIQSASESLILAIKSLPAGCYFNIMAFGSKYRTLFHSSVELTEKTMGRAVQFANQMQPYLGGTELLRPLNWVLKQPLCGSLPRQIFLITDGGVPNVRVVLESVSRHGQNSRFHTFALGPDICSELMAELATMTGGQCLVIEEEDRLQSKVIETLKASLQPSLLNAAVHWTPPSGYTIVDTIPRSFDTVFPNVTYSAFAVLQKTQDNPSINSPRPASMATLSGTMVGGEKSFAVPNHAIFQCKCDSSVDSEFAEAVLKACAWAKIHSLEEDCLRFRGNKATGEEAAGCEPVQKKPRLNGTSSSSVTSSPVRSLQTLQEQLQAYSLCSGVPCSLARHQAVGASGICHMTPLLAHGHHHQFGSANTASPPLGKKTSQQDVQASRKRKSSSDSFTSSFLASISLSTLAKSTVSTVSSAAKTAANIASFGLLSFDEPDLSMEAGERIEDQLYYQNKKERLHWDDQHQLVYPRFYFNSSHDGNPAVISPPGCGAQLQNGQSTSLPPLNKHQVFLEPNTNSVTANAVQSAAPGIEETCSAPSEHILSGNVCASALSMDKDIRIPWSFIPLVELQLVSGAWPLVQPVFCATGVSLATIQTLPSDHTCTNHFHGSNGINPSNEGHVWATAIAIACLREHYSQYKSEWELVALKGELWLSKHCTSLTDIHTCAQGLVCKKRQ